MLADMSINGVTGPGVPPFFNMAMPGYVPRHRRWAIGNDILYLTLWHQHGMPLLFPIVAQRAWRHDPRPYSYRHGRRWQS
jgi:hypothetical protein